MGDDPLQRLHGHRALLAFSKCCDAIDATRIHLTMTWVVSFSLSRPLKCSAQVLASKSGGPAAFYELKGAEDGGVLRLGDG